MQINVFVNRWSGKTIDEEEGGGGPQKQLYAQV